MITRGEIYKFIDKNFKISPEFLFKNHQNFAVFRHTNNKKWFCLFMPLNPKKLGLNGNNEIFVLNLKTDMANILINYKEIFPAYHMNKRHWISVLLNSNIEKELVFDLIKTSFDLTNRTY